MSKMKRYLEEIQEKVLNEIEGFNQRNLFNEYYREDFTKFIQGLEKKYNVKIDKISYEIS